MESIKNISHGTLQDAFMETLQDACAVFGAVTSNKENSHVYETLCLGLTALQHRGQESSGIVICKDGKFNIRKGMGLVSTVYTPDQSRLEGPSGIGHNRYSTKGTSTLINCQPFVVHTCDGQIAVAHNGELVNAVELRNKLLKQGIGLSTETDSEVMTQILVREALPCVDKKLIWVERIKNLMEQTQCSYSVLLLTAQDEIYAFRDPFGNRPLCIGETSYSSTNCKEESNNMYLVSSESCAFTSIGANLIRDVEPGEIVKLSKEGIEPMHNVKLSTNKKIAFCIFEYVYFARPDSIFEAQLVHSVRKECGRQLARESPVEADIVSTIPDSANPAARGFALESKIPFDDVVVKNRYVGRTFILPDDRARGVTSKFGPLHTNIRGKRIILIDDSIVRGNTMPRIVHLLKKNGAAEVHIRIASPPLKFPCFMGINIPTKSELIANKIDVNDLAEHMGANSLAYLSIEGLRSSVKKGIANENANHCTACLDGNYPVELQW